MKSISRHLTGAFVMAAILLAAVPSFTSCNKNGIDFTDGHSELKKVSDMLYEVTYSDYSTEAPNSSYLDIAGDMACSSVRNGDFHGRNFDYFANQCPTIVVRTTAKEGRYATIGVARLAKTSEAMIDSGQLKDKMGLLPWAMFDGMNEKGLVINSNVVSREDWGDRDHTGTDEKAPELNVIVAIRPLLDYCANIKEALDYLKAHNITPMASKKMNLHFMISDPDSTCVVEFINNKIVAKRQNIMTNYHLLKEEGGIPEYAIGVERYEILKEHYDLGGQSMQGMFDLMQMVRYTNMYKYPDYKLYSELVSPDQVSYTDIIKYPLIIKPELDKKLAEINKAWAEELKYIERDGFRESTTWWDTTHNSIYDIRKKILWVTVHERYDKVKEFTLKY